MFPQWVIESSKKEGCVDYSKLKAIPGSQYMSLLPYQTKQVTAFWKKLGQKVPIKTVVDACSHIGLDLINLALTFPEVKLTAIEIGKEEVKCLQHNVDVTGISGRVTIVNDSCVKYF